MDPQLALAGENPLKIRKVLDVQKIGQRFEYLVEQLDKPMSETSWFLLSDIPDLYDENLESFHQRHPKLPHPAKYPTARSSKTQQVIDALAPPPPDPLVQWQNHLYAPPTQMMTHSGRVSQPSNLDKITESITS